MSTDYALFMIFIPNDFDKQSTTRPRPSRDIQSVPSPHTAHAVSALFSSASIICPKPSRKPSLVRGDNEHAHEPSTHSLCVALTNYFTDKNHLEAVWMQSDDKKTYQVTFYVEFGFVSDRTLQELLKLGIGKRSNTKIFVLPTAIILEGHNESVSTLSLSEDQVLDETFPSTVESKLDDDTLRSKIRRRINESNFKKSVRARLMVHQVVASIRASTALSFDFVLLICLASMLAAFGLLENSTVVIVASMLVSPLMNPILGIAFGLSVREHSLWRRGLRNELIGLIICISCGFILGLFTTFAGTKWGNSTSFPTSEMRSRGDIKRLWVGVLIALPSGAGVALSVLGGNTGSLVGVAISASLLPPAVNCGLLFAYTILSHFFLHIPAVRPSLVNTMTVLNCTKYLDNDYQPLYTCDLATESAILAGCSLLLTFVNILCIIVMALFILRIKEVVPLHQPNQDIANFFHYDVKVARDYNKTITVGDPESTKLANSVLPRNNLRRSMIKRWKTLGSSISHDNELQIEIGQSSLMPNLNEPMDAELHQKLLSLNTLAKEYDLDVFHKRDYDLTDSTSRDKVRLLVSDLVDMCQEETPRVFSDLFHLQPCGAPSSTDKEHQSFYQEIIELLPPKWYELFSREQHRRQITSWSSSFNRAYSLRVPRVSKFQKSISQSNERHVGRFRRQSSVPESSLHSVSSTEETETPVEGTRFRIARPSTTTEMFAVE